MVLAAGLWGGSQPTLASPHLQRQEMLELVGKPSGEAESNTRGHSQGALRALEVVPCQVHVLAGVNFFFQVNS